MEAEDGTLKDVGGNDKPQVVSEENASEGKICK